MLSLDPRNQPVFQRPHLEPKSNPLPHHGGNTQSESTFRSTKYWCLSNTSNTLALCIAQEVLRIVAILMSLKLPHQCLAEGFYDSTQFSLQQKIWNLLVHNSKLRNLEKCKQGVQSSIDRLIGSQLCRQHNFENFSKEINYFSADRSTIDH